MEPLLFWIFSIGMLGGGIFVVLGRSPVASALGLVSSILFMAGLFVLLHAFFLAAIQVLVYAGAVIVLFLFIIMLLDLKAITRPHRNRFSFFLSLALIIFLGFLFFQMLPQVPTPEASAVLATPPYKNEISALGHLLYTKYLLPFEMTGLLLLVGTIGVVLLSKKGIGSETVSFQLSEKNKSSQEKDPTL